MAAIKYPNPNWDGQDPTTQYLTLPFGGIGDAPKDGNAYNRKDGDWEIALKPAATYDASAYIKANAAYGQSKFNITTDQFTELMNAIKDEKLIYIGISGNKILCTTSRMNGDTQVILAAQNQGYGFVNSTAGVNTTRVTLIVKSTGEVTQYSALANIISTGDGSMCQNDAGGYTGVLSTGVNPKDFIPTHANHPATKKYVDDIATNKVDKVSGKVLSSNDFTNTLKTKLDGLSNYNDTAVKTSISEEITRAKAAEKTNSDAITALGTAYKKADTSLEGKITAETTRATTAENTLDSKISTKVDKVTGKGLSTNDYTSTDKSKLTALPTASEIDTKINAAVGSVYRVKGSVANYAALPTANVVVGDVYNLTDTGANYVAISLNPITWDKLSETVDLSSYLTKTSAASTYQVKGNYLTSIPAEYVTDSELTAKGYLTTSIAARDYALKTEIPSITVDSSLSTTSVNPIQNKAVSTTLNNKVDKVSGKQLSTEDFTTAEKTKLASLSNYSDTTLKSNITANTNAINAEVTRAKAAEKVNADAIKDVEADVSTLTTTIGTKVDKVTGKQLSTNDYTTAEKNKLNGIEAGAQVNTVTSVAGRTGAVTLTKADIGLSNVSNTSDATKPISTATQTALNAKLNSASYTAADVLTKLKTVDGASSGLDADLLDGKQGSEYALKTDIPKAITVDTALSATSTNPVQNKVINTALDTKITAVSGKGLSTNDYTTAEKTKLAGLSNYNDTAIKADIATKANANNVYTKTEIDNKKFLTSVPSTYATKTYVDDAIANIPGGSGDFNYDIRLTIDANGNLTIPTGTYVGLLDAYNNNKQVTMTIIDAIVGDGTSRDLTFRVGQIIIGDTTDIFITCFPFVQSTYSEPTKLTAIVFGNFTISTNDTIVSTSMELQPFESFLAKDNETAYTPTKDYHPATKQYVDKYATGIKQRIVTKAQYDALVPETNVMYFITE